MILGRGTAQTDEAIIADFYTCLSNEPSIQSPKVLKRLRESAGVMCQRIHKPILEWTDDDIIALYQDRQQATQSAYNCFLTFLLYRGYRRASIYLLATLRLQLAKHWKTAYAPYRQRIDETSRELGYLEHGNITNTFVNLLTFTGKFLEELTWSDFEAFQQAHGQWYLQAKKKHAANGVDAAPDSRLFRLEHYLIHWGIFAPRPRTMHYEEHLTQVEQPFFQTTLLRYMDQCRVKYRVGTLYSVRRSLLEFFLWFQSQYPTAIRLADVTRLVALDYAQYLKKQGEEGRFGTFHQYELYSRIRRFFDFVIDEAIETAPSRNPFVVGDLSRKPDMIPRYLEDQELRVVLEYCQGEHASLLERTVVITLLHTGIRAAEFASLKASDIVQIGGVWKLHIHEGKGLKDRLIPLTQRCLAVLQEWQEKEWLRANDFLFTRYGRPWRGNIQVARIIREIGKKQGVVKLTPHRFRHTFAVSLLNYGLRESVLQKLMGHADMDTTLEYARILDQTVERSFSEVIEQMQEGSLSWVPNFFLQDEYTMFTEGDAVSWIRLPLGYCRRNAKLHCESDVKCLLCDRFAIGKEDLSRLQQMHERFLKLGLKVKADVVAAQIQRLELPSGESPQAFIPTYTISVARLPR